MDFQDFDLLGDPVDPNKGKRGRRTHVVNQEKRRLVVMLAALGRTNEQIAAALSVTGPTLRKHYKRELIDRTVARHRAEALIVSALMKEVAAGNVSAMRDLQLRLDKADMKFSIVDAVEEEMAAAAKLGKKAAANAAARTAHQKSSWADYIKPQ